MLMCIADQMAIAVITQSITYTKMFQGTCTVYLLPDREKFDILLFFSNSGPSEILGSDGKQNNAKLVLGGGGGGGLENLCTFH